MKTLIQRRGITVVEKCIIVLYCVTNLHMSQAGTSSTQLFIGEIKEAVC